jgi:D-tyrosyl-tRNA(Tyr) deacylase
MRLVVERVKQARVTVKGEVAGGIGPGLLVYVGIEKNDGEREVEFMADKIVNLRVFPDAKGKMNVNLIEAGGDVLSISQFTLASRIRKGRRPDFNNAELPEQAETLYRLFNDRLAESVRVEKGIFGAMMEVHSVNDGPVTFIIERQFS